MDVSCRFLFSYRHSLLACYIYTMNHGRKGRQMDYYFYIELTRKVATRKNKAGMNTAVAGQRPHATPFASSSPRCARMSVR